MWCDNLLEVAGTASDLSRFRARNKHVTIDKLGRLVEIPLYFGALLPRPPELDGVEESSMALRAYRALYGDWESLLSLRFIRDAGVRDRASLIRYIEENSPEHFELARRYRANESKYGFRNWHAWNLEHYGTQWDLDASTIIEEKPGKLIYRFQTFENPPMPWFELLSASYPELTMRLTHRNTWKLAQEADLPLNRFY